MSRLNEAELIQQVALRARGDGTITELVAALEREGVVGADGQRLPANTVGNWCRGLASPPYPALFALARLGRTSLDYLAGLYGEPRLVEPPEGDLAPDMARMLAEANVALREVSAALRSARKGRSA